MSEKYDLCKINPILANFDFYDESRNELAVSTFLSIAEKYELISYGRNRVAFRLKSGNYVLKFPFSDLGETDNDWEGSIVSNKKEKNTDEIRYPKTKIVYINGFECVIMDFIVDLSEITHEVAMEDWFGSVDCWQVGETKKGKYIVAYDYGIR